jgi:hypothetical protein
MKKFITLSMLFMATAVFAQEETTEPAAAPTGLTVSGSVDAYYKANLTAPNNSGEDFGTAFANQTGFALGMANVVLSYEGAKAGVVVDLVTGPRGAGATFGTDIVDGIVNQAYVYWNVSDKTTLTFGRWNTFVGYEVIAPAANFNYSCSYLFSNGPFSQMGLKADFSLSDDWSLMLAATNPWDVNDVTATGEIAFGAQLGYSGQYLNIYYDSGNNEGLGTEIDYTGGFDVTEDFFLGINAAYNVNSSDPSMNSVAYGFYGAALYPQVAMSESFSLGLRGEYFAWHMEGATDLPSVFATTLTGSYTVDNLIIKPEVRLDSLTNSTGGLMTPSGVMGKFVDDKGMPSDSLAAFTLAAIYTF